MSDRMAEAPWLEYVLEAIYHSQWQLLQWLHQWQWVAEEDGQPAWPWSWRLSGEHLLLDVGQARALLVSMLVVLLLCASALLAWRWHWWRVPFAATTLLALWCTPWPHAHVLLVPAHPSSFHQPAVPWSDQAIAAGARHYAAHCVQCHGADGKGQGPLAAQQAVWPPNFASPLLWRKADGDLYAHVRHGVRNHSGAVTMPGFAHALSAQATWQVLHFLRAQAAGQILQATGEWAQPVRMPDMRLHCRAPHRQSVSDWQGQRLLWVTGAIDAIQPDPRLVTVWLPAGIPPAQIPAQVDCVVASTESAQLAWQHVTAQAVTQPQQIMSDRDGWLRARNTSDATGWSEESLICTTNTNDATTAKPAENTDGLTRLLRVMDNTPVRFVKGGRVH